MGAGCRLDDDGLTVTAGDRLDGLDADLADCTELVPALVALAALARTPSTLRGIGHMRGHETDRLAALATELTRLGGEVAETADGAADRAAAVARRHRPDVRTTTGWPCSARSSGSPSPACWSRTWRRPARPCRTSWTAGSACSAPPRPEPRTDPAPAGGPARPAPRPGGAGRPPGTAGDRPAGPAGRDADRAWRRPDSRSGSRLDEDDVRVRPGRGSRPRTRTRPAHAEATPGFVIAVDRGRYTVLVERPRTVTAVQARELGRHSVVVGDRVALVGDVSGAHRHAGPDRPGGAAPDRAAPQRRRRRPARSGSIVATPTSWWWSPRWPTRRRGSG